MTNRTHDTDVREVTPDEVLARIVHDAATDAEEVKDTQDELRRHLLTLLAWTKPTGEIDESEVLAAFSDAAKIAERVGHHAREREVLVDQATAMVLIRRGQNATTEES